MEKNVVVNVRVDEKLKKDVDYVLNSIGIPMSVAITMYLKEIAKNGRIPFQPVAKRNFPLPVYEDLTEEELNAILDEAEDDIKNGRVYTMEEIAKKYNVEL